MPREMRSGMIQPSAKVATHITINGREHVVEHDVRLLLVEYIRVHLGLTGTHVGCDTTQCGACTVHLDGEAVKSCTVLVAQLNNAEVKTIEALGKPGALHPMQAAFREHHGLQCGYCTPGMVMMACDILRREPKPSEATIRHNLEGNICRCTGYHNIVKSIQAAAGILEPETDTV